VSRMRRCHAMTGMGATSDQQRSRSRAHDGTARAFSKRSLIRRTRPTGRRADTAVPVRRCSAGMSQCQLLGRRRCSSWSATEARNQRKALQGRPSSNSCGGCLGAAAADEGGGDSSPALCPKSRAKAKTPQSADQGLKALRCCCFLSDYLCHRAMVTKSPVFSNWDIRGGHCNLSSRSVDRKADRGISCRAQVPPVFAAGRVEMLSHEGPPFIRSDECSRRHQPPQLLSRGLVVLLLRSFTPVFEP